MWKQLIDTHAAAGARRGKSVSIVIPTLNRRAALRRSAGGPSERRCSIARWQILVVRLWFH